MAASFGFTSFLLGASVLSTLQVVPKGIDVVDQVSLIFTETLGPTAKSIFMVGAFCTLLSTLLVFAASSGRIGADFIHLLGVGSAQNALQLQQELLLLFVRARCEQESTGSNGG